MDAIRGELDSGGLLLRNCAGGIAGAFIACTFWLAKFLAGQGRIEEASEAFERAGRARNDLGVFAEEFDARSGEMASNFPQALAHLAHISAATALTAARRRRPSSPGR